MRMRTVPHMLLFKYSNLIILREQQSVIVIIFLYKLQHELRCFTGCDCGTIFGNYYTVLFITRRNRFAVLCIQCRKSAVHISFRYFQFQETNKLLSKIVTIPQRIIRWNKMLASTILFRRTYLYCNILVVFNFSSASLTFLPSFKMKKCDKMSFPIILILVYVYK